MAEVSIATLKGYFQTGKYPTQTQFENLIDSLWRIIELQVADGWIQWSVAGSGNWINLLEIGVSGSFESADNKTITVTNGIITDIQ